MKKKFWSEVEDKTKMSASERIQAHIEWFEEPRSVYQYAIRLIGIALEFLTLSFFINLLLDKLYHQFEKSNHLKNAALVIPYVVFLVLNFAVSLINGIANAAIFVALLPILAPLNFLKNYISNRNEDKQTKQSETSTHENVRNAIENTSGVSQDVMDAVQNSQHQIEKSKSVVSEWRNFMTRRNNQNDIVIEPPTKKNKLTK